MKDITVRNQAELDNLPIDYDGRIYIEFGTPYNRAVVNRRFKYSVVARGNSSVEAWGNSSVVARENSSVEAWGNSSVEAWGNTQVCDNSRTHNVKVSGNARVVYNPKTAHEYLGFYGIPAFENTCKLYKAVRKHDGRYFSDWDSGFEYVIGGDAVANGLNTDPMEDCGHGIHMAYKEWCVDYGRDWENLAIIEVEAVIENIIVPVYGSGKVRTDKVKVIREVPLDECGLLGKTLLRKREKYGKE